MVDDVLYLLAQDVGQKLQSKNLVLVTAESCTGGWVSEAITAIAGSSSWFDCGFVTYSNQAKQRILNVSAETLQGFGAVSEQTVKEMTLGALQESNANIAVAISGIAGPGGALPDKPVGTVCFAWQFANGEAIAETYLFSGDRTEIRQQAVMKALQGILARIES